KGGLGGRVAVGRGADDRRRVARDSARRLVVPRQPRAGQPGLDAAGETAVAGWPGQLVRRRPRQRLMWLAFRGWSILLLAPGAALLAAAAAGERILTGEAASGIRSASAAAGTGRPACAPGRRKWR